MAETQSSQGRHHLTFTLTRAAVNEREQAIFADDLASLGLDATTWLVLNGTVETGTRATIPKVLRAYRHDELVGVAYILECRRVGQCFFDGPVASMMDLAALPLFVWTRNGAMIDGNANPGFVAAGVDRDDFFAQSIAYLTRRYPYGSVLDYPEAFSGPGYVATPLFDSGIIHLEGVASVEDYSADSKNLRRKVNKFRNKGGAVEVIRGALPDDLRAEALRCLASLKPLVRAPFQDNYANMAMQACSLASDRVVHFIARLNGDVVGYHSFAVAGRSLHCLSGAFDRTRTSTYHAYENVILESIRFGLDHGLTTIYYGPITNPTKAKLMNAYSRCEVRNYSRLVPLRAVFPAMIRASKLAPATFKDFIGIQPLAQSG